MRFCKKEPDLFWKVKNNFRFVKEKSDLFLGTKKKKKDFLKEDPHSWDKFIMHASHIKKKKKKFNLTFNPFFSISKSAILWQGKLFLKENQIWI